MKIIFHVMQISDDLAHMRSIASAELYNSVMMKIGALSPLVDFRGATEDLDHVTVLSFMLCSGIFYSSLPYSLL